MNVIFLSETKSTQKLAIEMIQKGEILQNTLIYTEKQTNGVGRSDKTWIMTEKNIAMSIIFEIKNFLLPYSILTGYILLEFFNEYGVKLSIKWPNDMYLNGKKIGGIITNIEDFDGKKYCVLGIGVNLNSSPENQDPDYQISNILTETNIFIESKKAALKIAEKILSVNFEKAKEGILEKISKNLYGIGKKCICNGVEGIFSGIDKEGNAVVKTRSGEDAVFFSSSIRFF